MTVNCRDIVALLEQGITVITPIRRLSRYLLEQYARSQLVQGRQAWETPDCLPWNAWLVRTWQDLAAGGRQATVLLSTFQQQRLWQSVVQSSPRSGQVLQPANTARQLQRTRNRCLEWQIPVFPADGFIHDDAYAFQQWHDEYVSVCQSRGWIDDAALPGLVEQSVTSLTPQHVALYGFDQITPQMSALLAALEKAGFNITRVDEIRRNETVARYPAFDTGAEIRAAAHWARRRLAEDAAHIGIVMQDVQAQQPRLQTIFEDVLCPGNVLVGERKALPFSISQGRPLSAYPLIHTALACLGTGRVSFRFEDISDLFRTPFIHSAGKEAQQRARLEQAIRRQAEYHLNRTTLLQLARGALPADQCPGDFLDVLENAVSLMDSVRQRQSANAWARHFSAVLKTFGWPGARTLDSAEYQTLREWQSTLSQFAALDQLAGDWHYSEALSALRYILNQSGFQPETSEAPVQIMGTTAAAGMQFDHLWIMGLSEDHWPQPGTPDPFIPLALQRQYQLPDATPEQRLARSRRLLQRLVAASPEVVMSYPQQENDRPLRPGPLVRHFATDDGVAIDMAPDYATVIHAARQLETLADNTAPPVPAGADQRGGTALFRDQAACPFRAFARHRLFAEGMESRDIGLGAPDRGQIVHRVLEAFWSRVTSQAALQSLSPEQLWHTIHDVIEDVVGRYRRHFPNTMGRRFSVLEAERLAALVHEMLTLELQRQPFQVLSCEQDDTFDFAGINVHLRTDRVDQLDDGRQVIIDYKTGAMTPSPGSWMSGRPDEPQLPLYAIHARDRIGAVVFVRARRGQSVFSGVAAETGMLPGIRPVPETTGVKDWVTDWDALLQQWQDVLTALAEDFRQGQAMVDPKSADSCRYCDLHAFCRIHDQETRFDDTTE